MDNSDYKVISGGPSSLELDAAHLNKTPVLFEDELSKNIFDVIIDEMEDVSKHGMDMRKIKATLLLDNKKLLIHYSFVHRRGFYEFLM